MNRNVKLFIINNKNLYGGIGIVLVLLYHLLCLDESVSFYWLFYPGFIGVDLFMFYSGYSLCFSYNKNSLIDFYKRRIKRVGPIFLLLAITKTFLYILRGNDVSLFDWLCNISTLSYYGIGGQFIDWYLCALFLYYLLFPGIMYITKCIKLGGAFLLSIILVVTLSIYNIDWTYGAAIARLPMFMLGIVFFQNKELIKFESFLWFVIPMFLSIALYLYHTNIGGYTIMDMCTPLLMYVIALIFGNIKPKLCSWIQYIGMHSLEIYVGNVIVMAIIAFWIKGSMHIFLWYWVLNLAISFVLIQISNKKIGVNANS